HPMKGQRMLGAVQIILAVVWLLLPAHALAGPAEEAGAAIDQWIAAFNENNAELLSRLYAPDALLHGISSPRLYIGNEAIREYFTNFHGNTRNARIAERHTIILSASAVIAVGFYNFDVVMNGQTVPRLARFTFILA